MAVSFAKLPELLRRTPSHKQQFEGLAAREYWGKTAVLFLATSLSHYMCMAQKLFFGSK